MRLRVKFRFHTDTGEVEVFRVDDLRDGPPLPDHDQRHEAATRDLARVVDPHARIVEEIEAIAESEPPEPEPVIPDPEPAPPSREVHRA